MMFVVRSGPVRPKRSTVSVSCSPSRMDAAAPGWSSSSERARCSRARPSRSHAYDGRARDGGLRLPRGIPAASLKQDRRGDGPGRRRVFRGEYPRPH